MLLCALALAAPYDPAARPVRANQDPNPRGQVDYTAATLDIGEIRVSPWAVGMGMSRRIHVTTQPLLDAAQVANGSMRWNVVRAGPVDLSVGGGYGQSTGGDIDARFARGEAAVSVTPHEAWSLHGRAAWVSAEVDGVPRLDLAAQVAGEWLPTPDTSPLAAAGTAIVAHAATDVRFNGRDSLVLQGQSVLATAPGFGADPGATWEEGRQPVGSTWAASLAYQVSFRNLDLRAGIGWSTVPGAWATQAFDLSYRFGGERRENERARMVAWRRHQRAYGGGNDAVASAAPVPGSPVDPSFFTEAEE